MKNYKTTIAGIIAGAIPFLQGVSDSLGAGVPIKWLPIMMGLAIMALGVLAKDIGQVAKVLVVCFAATSLNACSVFGTPTPKVGQCFDWCIVTVIQPTQGEAAICYDTEAKMLAAKKSFEAEGKKVTIR